MIFVTELTELKEEAAARGRFKGNIVKSRKVLAADNWNWLIGTERGGEGGNIAGEKFYGSLRILLPEIFAQFPAKFQSVIDRIALATSMTETLSLPIKSIQEAEALGKMFDEKYGTSYMGHPHPPTVLKRLFKVEETE